MLPECVYSEQSGRLVIAISKSSMKLTSMRLECFRKPEYLGKHHAGMPEARFGISHPQPQNCATHDSTNGTQTLIIRHNHKWDEARCSSPVLLSHLLRLTVCSSWGSSIAYVPQMSSRSLEQKK